MRCNFLIRSEIHDTKNVLSFKFLNECDPKNSQEKRTHL